MFAEVTGEKLVGGPFWSPPILNRVNVENNDNDHKFEVGESCKDIKIKKTFLQKVTLQICEKNFLILKRLK